jgi:Family of unknown function (DUF6174)
MNRARVKAFLAGSIALGMIPGACHRRASAPPPTQTQPDVRREVKDRTRVVAVRDTSVMIFFRDTAPNAVLGARGRSFNLQRPEERESLRATLRKERELWRSSKPRDYRFLLRVGCFCPGTRGWLLMEVRSGQPLRAWDKTGQSVALTDWNTLSVDGLYDNLEGWADRDGTVQIEFDPRWHLPTHIRTNAARGPDAWGVTEARALRPLR